MLHDRVQPRASGQTLPDSRQVNLDCMFLRIKHVSMVLVMVQELHRCAKWVQLMQLFSLCSLLAPY